MLSIAPHQEARFLLPMLPSLALVCNNAFLNKKNQEKREYAIEFFIEKVVGYIIRAVWVFFNLSMVIFFGFVHQGGVLQASLDMHNTISDTNAHVIFYNSYFAPRSFMTSFNSSRNVSVEDFAEKSYQPAAALMNHIEEIWKANRNQFAGDFAIYLCIPTPAAKSLHLPPAKHLPQMFKWTLIKEYFPHFSMENILPTWITL
jgi:phosphatidylinositol glycan class Z